MKVYICLVLGAVIAIAVAKAIPPSSLEADKPKPSKSSVEIPKTLLKTSLNTSSVDDSSAPDHSFEEGNEPSENHGPSGYQNQFQSQQTQAPQEEKASMPLNQLETYSSDGGADETSYQSQSQQMGDNQQTEQIPKTGEESLQSQQQQASSDVQHQQAQFQEPESSQANIPQQTLIKPDQFQQEQAQFQELESPQANIPQQTLIKPDQSHDQYVVRPQQSQTPQEPIEQLQQPDTPQQISSQTEQPSQVVQQTDKSQFQNVQNEDSQHAQVQPEKQTESEIPSSQIAQQEPIEQAQRLDQQYGGNAEPSQQSEKLPSFPLSKQLKVKKVLADI